MCLVSMFLRVVLTADVVVVAAVQQRIAFVALLQVLSLALSEALNSFARKVSSLCY